MSVAFGCLGRGKALEVTWQHQTDPERHWGRAFWCEGFRLFFQNNEATPECHRCWLRTNRRQDEIYKHLFLWGLIHEEHSAAVTCASTTATNRSDWYCSSKQNDQAGEFKQLETSYHPLSHTHSHTVCNSPLSWCTRHSPALSPSAPFPLVPTQLCPKCWVVIATKQKPCDVIRMRQMQHQQRMLMEDGDGKPAARSAGWCHTKEAQCRFLLQPFQLLS